VNAAIDLGITNIHVILRRGVELPPDYRGLDYTRLDTTRQPVLEQVASVLAMLERDGAQVLRAAVTGGKYRSLPESVGGVHLVKITEVDAIGRGGLYLSGLPEALVVSAGSGTAMVAARGRSATHVTGSAVGGGTLQGLGRLLLRTADPQEIDRLAQQGDANRADLTLAEVLGGAVGRLPVNANAVNFGRLGREAVNVSLPDLAAALVRLVGQVIAVIAINAAKAEGLETIVMTGHLVDLLSVRGVLDEDIRMPHLPGSGTATGALLCMED
jgi:type II pantothenate kinase